MPTSAERLRRVDLLIRKAAAMAISQGRTGRDICDALDEAREELSALKGGTPEIGDASGDRRSGARLGAAVGETNTSLRTKPARPVLILIKS